MPEKTLVIKKMYSVRHNLFVTDDVNGCTVSLHAVKAGETKHIETLVGKISKPGSRGYYSRKLDVPEDAEVRWSSTTPNCTVEIEIDGISVERMEGENA